MCPDSKELGEEDSLKEEIYDDDDDDDVDGIDEPCCEPEPREGE